MSNNCNTCRWQERENPGEVCRRHPPQVVDEGDTTISLFPDCPHKGGCGEWRETIEEEHRKFTERNQRRIDYWNAAAERHTP